MGRHLRRRAVLRRHRDEPIGGEVVELGPGDTIHTPPGQWHWHGAAPDHFMTHLAIWEAPDGGQTPETEWGELVSDDEYDAR